MKFRSQKLSAFLPTESILIIDIFLLAHGSALFFSNLLFIFHSAEFVGIHEDNDAGYTHS